LRNTSKGTLENRRAQFLEGPGKTKDGGDCATGINTEYSEDTNGAQQTPNVTGIFDRNGNG
jgi:hypothetical protein